MLAVRRASRGDWLVDGLADLLNQRSGDDPMVPEVVAVPTRGVERWLSQRLSLRLGAPEGRTDGVCANILFPFPGNLVSHALGVATDVDPEQDPWAPERLVWPLLELVEARIGEPWLIRLARHLGALSPEPDEARQSRRFSTVRHLADLFDRYGVHRPAMIRAWAAGRDLDGRDEPLRSDVGWQSRLWRELRAALGVPSPAERLVIGCQVLSEQPGLLDLPARLSLFGLTRLPASYLDVLTAISAGRDVHLWLLHPSAALWTTLAASLEAPVRLVPRRADSTAATVRNPLLATWGRDAREMQLVLAAGRVSGPEALPDGSHPETLLGWIQSDIRADRAPPGPGIPESEDPRRTLAPDDRSLQVHACHGRARQVEVLRDAILGALEDDPTIEPRDVIVMCPDIDTFAPLIQATFGGGTTVADANPSEGSSGPASRSEGRSSAGPALHVRLADRSIRQTNPIFGALTELLALAAGRATASEILGFIGSGPVRSRFELDDDDLSRVDGWIREAGARWGLDAGSRQPYLLDQLPDGTWLAALDRILLGVAMSEEDLRLVDGVLPLDDVGSGDVDLVGRLAELTDRMAAVLELLRHPRTLAAWTTVLAGAADVLMATGRDDEWQRGQLQAVLDEVSAAAGQPTEVMLSLTEVRSLLADRLRGRP
ncbi:MAG: exodeoxyribonuclease V subunit gamma, partial [Actinomycetota bacterium]|nr:exodeoxyribonuclease V subunit gamma [Actinomycetota bacterium]